MMQARLASLAVSMKLNCAQAVALPTAVEVGARKVGISSERFVREMETNKELRDYIKFVCADAESTVHSIAAA